MAMSLVYGLTRRGQLRHQEQFPNLPLKMSYQAMVIS